jgi:hypothetical protein
MPIRPDLRPFYRGPAWKATRERIMKRAKNRCEQCGKRNHRRVYARYLRLMGEPRMWWSYGCTVWRDHTGRRATPPRFSRETRVRVICTVAHLNHVSGDDRDENLKFLCQWCHLNYDKLHHRQTRITRKDAARPIQWQGAISV